MSNAASKSINIFLALDKKAVESYFNPHDTAPIYKRQLSLSFESYLNNALKDCKRFDPVFFKLNRVNKIDEQFADPVMYAIRGHFAKKKELEFKAFRQFKRRNYGVIVGCLLLSSALNFILPRLMSKEVAFNIGLTHFIDVFSFILFYHPLTELLFNWNPFLKRINLLNKLIKAEVIFVGNIERAASANPAFEAYKPEGNGMVVMD